MKDFILLSNGPKGIFSLEKSTLQECKDAALKEILSGQTCGIYYKHSDVIMPEVVLKKTDAQIAIETAQAVEAPAEEIKP